MDNGKAVFRLTLACLLLLALAHAADAPKLTFKFKQVNFPGAAGTSAYGLNDAGVIVGQYYDSAGVFHGYVLDHGRGTTIDDPNGSNTLCADINASGVIVGEYTAPDGDNHGFRYENGKFKEIAPDNLSGADGINEQGLIVGGFAHCDFCQQHGFLWNKHKFKQLDVPGAMWTGAGSINNQGVITIIAPDNDNLYHSYLYRNKKYSEIKVPGAYETFIESINNDGDLGFTWDAKKGNDHSAIRFKGHFYKFDYRKGYDTLLTKLNTKRTIVGNYIGVGKVGAFKATF